jgi:acetyl esterase/lipase
MSKPALASRVLAALLRASGNKYRNFPPARLEAWARTPRTPYRGMPPRRFRRQIQVRREDQGGWPVYEVEPIAPARGAPRGQLLFLHGGAYVWDFEPRLYWGVVAKLATRLGRTLTVPIYPVAPEHTHRDAFPLLVSLYERILASHPASEIAFIGDSAGGGLALALCHALREAGLPQPSDAVLLSPWLDLSLSDPAVPEVAKVDPLLDPEHLRECGRRWAGGEPLESPLLSPLYAPLRGLAKVTIFTGTHDVLNPDARRLHARARAEGVEIGWYEAEGQLHDWMFGFGRDARAALQRIAEVLEPRPRV